MEPSGRRYALFGVILGCAAALCLNLLRYRLSSEPEQVVDLARIAFALTLFAPFLLALVALFFDSARARCGIWLGAGILGVLGSGIAFSGVSLVMLPAGILLILASLRTCVTLPIPLGPVLVAAVMAVTGVASFLMLYTSEDPVCWIGTFRDGRVVWEARPGDPSRTMVMSGSGSSVCTSDITARAEARASILVWAIGSPLVLALSYLDGRRDGRSASAEMAVPR